MGSPLFLTNIDHKTKMKNDSMKNKTPTKERHNIGFNLHYGSLTCSLYAPLHRHIHVAPLNICVAPAAFVSL